MARVLSSRAALGVAALSLFMGLMSANAVADLDPKAIAIQMPKDIKWVRNGGAESAVLVGDRVALENRACVNRIRRSQAVYESWTDWYREVIWYGNKKGAYLYGNDAAERELAGHY